MLRPRDEIREEDLPSDRVMEALPDSRSPATPVGRRRRSLGSPSGRAPSRAPRRSLGRRRGCDTPRAPPTSPVPPASARRTRHTPRSNRRTTSRTPRRPPRRVVGSYCSVDRPASRTWTRRRNIGAARVMHDPGPA